MKLSSANEIKYGALLSYVLVVLNSVYGLAISPFVMTTVGTGQYGVYRIMASLSAALTVLDLGFGSTVTRYSAKYRAEGKQSSIGNFIAMTLRQVSILSVIVLLVGIVTSVCIRPVYGAQLSEAELQLAVQIFYVMLGNICLNFFVNVFIGVINGQEKFVITNFLRIGMIVFKIASLLLLLPIFKNVLINSVIDLVSTVIIALFCIWYVLSKLKIRIKLVHWDKSLFKEAFGYTILMFIQSLVIQFNGNVDNVVLGAVTGTVAVTVYSFSIQIFNMFENLSCSFSGLMLPRVSCQIAAGDSAEKMQQSVERVGRVQFMILGAALAGYLILGKEFFMLWLGEGFEDCWLLALILIVPVLFPLIQNTCLAILRAKNLMKFRTASLVISFVVNCIFTVIGTHFWGYWAAAAGTSISTLIGLVTMNWYYKKKLNFRIFQMFCNIFKRILLCLVISGAVMYLTHRVFYGSWLTFFINVCIFVLCYAITLWIFGLDKTEKKMIFRK